ncbi:MAG: hypothetical protein JWO17_2507 [Actinomycetia bacterium]|nr:hypothetical protein [Actinomycetes bacterium]
MRVFAFALVAAVLIVPSATATPHGLKLLVRDGNRLALVYLDRITPFRQPLHPEPYRNLAFSGDGRLVSIGGTILGRAKLPTQTLAWAPTGERAAYTTTEGAVVLWTPAGTRQIEPKGWGAGRFLPALAWSRSGALAITRGNSIWVWRDGVSQQMIGPVPNSGIPVPVAWHGTHLLWWVWPDSGSIAADGVTLYEDSRVLGTTLTYHDYSTVCGEHVAFVQGGNRYSTSGKALTFDGRIVARDSAHSWVSPSCTPDGHLVAAASRNIVPPLTTETHRAIWQLLPTRKQVTRPPWGWSDEDPHLFQNGDLLFVRSRITSKRDGNTWRDTAKGHVMVLSHGRLQEVAKIGYMQDESKGVYLGPYYGHYDWSYFVAVHE